jgi:hypothetical protein
MKKKLTPTEIEHLLRTKLTVSVMVAGAALGLAKNASYEAAGRGEIQTIRLGGKSVCPTAPLRKRLGISDQDSRAA